MSPARFITSLILVVTGCLLPINPLQAKQRLCRVVYPERPRNAPKSAYFFDGEKSRMVSLPSMNLSEIIRLPDGELTIALTQAEVVDPKLLSPDVPLLRISETTGDFYIILTPDPNNPHLPVKMNLVDTGGGKLKPGETLWFNMTDHRIVAKLGMADLSIDPKGRTISKSPVEKSGHYAARFAFHAHGKGPLAPITEQNWWHDTQSRYLGFMVNTGGKLPKIYFYRDFRDPEPTEEEKAAIVSDVYPESAPGEGN